MDRTAFTHPSGRIVRTPQDYEAFVPDALPRHLDLDAELVYLLSEADRTLGELAGMARTLPNPQLLVAPLSHREAVLSSRIEGTQASISDLAVFEAAGEAAPGTPGDVLEVLNYRRAMDYGVERMASLPLSLRLVRELHERLMRGVRGQESTPGEFRRSQNWIGSPGSTLNAATYVPPPPAELMSCLGEWEDFLHAEIRVPALVKCALMHYQFEAIHPFLDGNGRVGRLLLVLFLCNTGHLPAPVLYLSPFFEKNRQAYYGHLRAVSETSAWAEWLTFFLNGVVAQSKDAFIRTERLRRLYERYRVALLEAKAPPAAQRLMDGIFVAPATTAAQAAEVLGMTIVSATRAIESLSEHGILEEVTGRRRNRIYLAKGVVEAIEAETEVNSVFSNQPILL